MKPILFNTDMVSAILEGRKTVTRRVIKGQDKNTMYAGSCILGAGLFDKETKERVIEPPYKVGDVLYVRETWKPAGKGKKYFYKADWEIDGITGVTKWKPSIHMPKEAARIFLKITSIKAALLRDMWLEDFIKEGIIPSRAEMKNYVDALYNARELFKDLWNSTAGKPHTPERYANSWIGNPYVWVIEFEVITAEQAQGK